MPISDRRDFLYGIANTAAVAALGNKFERGGSKRKNVLFLAVDDLRGSLGCLGDRYAITPNIDGLAHQGTLFRHAYCQQAVCNPSRQSLMTGRRPDSIRVWDMKTHFRHTSPGVVSVPEHFRNQGYFAQSFGKIFHGEAPMADPQSWSVPEQFEYTPKSDDYQLVKNHVQRVAGKGDVDEFVDAPDDAYPDGKVAAEAVATLKSFSKGNNSQPFFLAVGMRKPHLPFTAPQRYWKMFDDRPVPPITRPEAPEGAPAIALHDSVELRGYLGIPAKGIIPPAMAEHLRRGYYVSLAYTDAQFGRVLRALRETGLEKDTLIVLWVDHGFHLGEHGLWCKTTNYELDTRIPLIIVNPSVAKRSQVCDATVELLDLFPTLCELCRIPPAPGLEGRSLVPYLNGLQKTSMKPALSQFPRPWFYRGAPEVMGYALRTDTHRYIEWRDFRSGTVTERELYDMRDAEPIEQVNLARLASSQELMERMSLMLPKPMKHEASS